MLAHRPIMRLPARIIVDRRRPSQVRVLEVGEFTEQVTPIVIECETISVS